MKNIMRTGRVVAFITPDKMGYVVMGDVDATDEEIRAAIAAEQELERWREVREWN